MTEDRGGRRWSFDKLALLRWVSIGGVSIEPVAQTDVEALRDFLSEIDLTLAGLEAHTARLWIERDASVCIIGSTGYELSADGRHSLIRGVGVAPLSALWVPAREVRPDGCRQSRSYASVAVFSPVRSLLVEARIPARRPRYARGCFVADSPSAALRREWATRAQNRLVPLDDLSR
jgi:hypothetical protein